jgi:hypothetical protein
MSILFTSIEIEDWPSKFVVSCIHPVPVLEGSMIGSIIMVHGNVDMVCWVVRSIDRNFSFTQVGWQIEMAMCLTSEKRGAQKQTTEVRQHYERDELSSHTVSSVFEQVAQYSP